MALTPMQQINIGTVPGDGTGDLLRDAFDKTNQNIAELDSRNGFGAYSDSTYTSGSPLAIAQTPVRIPCDAVLLDQTVTREPGVTSYWDATNNRFQSLTINSVYTVVVTALLLPAMPSNADAWGTFRLKVDSGDPATDRVIIARDRPFLRGDNVEVHADFLYTLIAASDIVADGVYAEAVMSDETISAYDLSFKIARIV